MFFVYENLVIPLKSLCEDHRGDQRIVEISALLIDCQHTYASVVYNKKFYSKHFYEIAENLLHTKQEIEMLVKNIS